VCFGYLKSKSYNELESEDVRFRAYLEDHGYDTSFYGESLIDESKTTVFKVGA
jgi:hypothetical protein